MFTIDKKRIGCLMLAVLIGAALLGCAPKEPAAEAITEFSQLKGGSCGIANTIWPGDSSLFAASLYGDELQYARCADMNEAFFKLANKDVDCLLVPDFVATYLTLREPALGMIEGPAAEHGVSMMLRIEDSALRDEIDAALADMRADGTLSALHEEWVTDLYPFKVLEGEELPPVDGARVVRVGLSAELEPLDYIDAEGLAGGYSAKLLGELGTRLGIGFAPVRVDTQGSLNMLADGVVDALFAVEAGTLEQAASSYAGLFTAPHFAYGRQHYLVARDYTRLRGCTDMARTNSRSGGGASPFKEFIQ